MPFLPGVLKSILIFFSALLSVAQMSGQTGWSQAFGGSEEDIAHCARITDNGDILVFGQTTSFGQGQRDFILLKLSSAGQLEWAKTYGTSEDEFGRGAVILLDDQGNIYCCGQYGNDTTHGNALVFKLNSDGDLLWGKEIGSWAGHDYARDMLLASDGNIVVAGSIASSGAGSHDSAIMKFTPEGVLLFGSTLGGTTNDHAMSVFEDSEGNYTISGHTKSFTQNSDDRDLMQSTWSSDGQFLQCKVEQRDGYDHINSIVQLDNGSIASVGYTQASGEYGALVMLQDPELEIVWSKILIADHQLRGVEITRFQNGLLSVLKGVHDEGDYDHSIYFVFMDMNGNLVWQQHFESPGEYRIEHGSKNMESPDLENLTWVMSHDTTGVFDIAVSTMNETEIKNCSVPSNLVIEDQEFSSLVPSPTILPIDVANDRVLIQSNILDMEERPVGDCGLVTTHLMEEAIYGEKNFFVQWQDNGILISNNGLPGLFTVNVYDVLGRKHSRRTHQVIDQMFSEIDFSDALNIIEVIGPHSNRVVLKNSAFR